MTILYGTLFGRGADADELDAGEAVLRAALVAALNDGFVLSPEAQAHMAKVCGT